MSLGNGNLSPYEKKKKKKARRETKGKREMN